MPSSLRRYAEYYSKCFLLQLHYYLHESSYLEYLSCLLLFIYIFKSPKFPCEVSCETARDAGLTSKTIRLTLAILHLLVIINGPILTVDNTPSAFELGRRLRRLISCL